MNELILMILIVAAYPVILYGINAARNAIEAKRIKEYAPQPLRVSRWADSSVTKKLENRTVRNSREQNLRPSYREL